MTSNRSALGAKTLPGKYFTSADVFDRESRAVFATHWICIGRADDIPRVGDFVRHDLDGESLIVLRDHDQGVKCFYNVCRHRGTRLTTQSSGHFDKHIRCPYHAWAYRLDGELAGAPNMSTTEDFCSSEYGLRQVACSVWHGFVMINLDPEASSFAASYPSITSRFLPWELDELVSAHQISYDVRANWKLIFQNYNECYHCSQVHPQLTPLTTVNTATNDFNEGCFLGGPMTLSDQYATISTDGSYCGARFPLLNEEDARRVYFYTLFPSLFISPHPDYVLTHRIERLATDATRITCDWLFPQRITKRQGFDPTGAISFWDLTNRQDWEVCELTQQGVSSRAYEPGPYSNLESVLASFDAYYLEVLAAAEGDT